MRIIDVHRVGEEILIELLNDEETEGYEVRLLEIEAKGILAQLDKALKA